MAEEHPPSPKRGDNTHAFGRLRVKPAMTVKGRKQSKKKHYGRIKKKTIVPGSH